MTTTEDVLAQIADALDDWDVGPDAMRCGAPAGTLPRDAWLDAWLVTYPPERRPAGWTLLDEPGGRP